MNFPIDIQIQEEDGLNSGTKIASINHDKSAVKSVAKSVAMRWLMVCWYYIIMNYELL